MNAATPRPSVDGIATMSRRIRPYEASDHARVLEICIAAFTPIHAGFEAAFGSEIFRRQYGDWRATYAETLRAIGDTDTSTRVHVALEHGTVVGFVFTHIDARTEVGEIGLNAVDPTHQSRGVGKAMYAFALAELKRRGAEVATVATGDDEAHAPARAAYESVGFDRSIPARHYFMRL